MNKLQNLTHHTTFWLSLIIFSLSMEGVALFYQYVLEEPPCVLCIHFRLLFLAIVLISFFAIIVKGFRIGRLISILMLLTISLGLAERSYQLLGTERHFVLSECTFTLNFPSWIAVDKWMPWLFEPLTSCGYTPEILFGITMAESLSALSLLMVIFSLLLLIVFWLPKKT